MKGVILRLAKRATPHGDRFSRVGLGNPEKAPWFARWSTEIPVAAGVVLGRRPVGQSFPWQAPSQLCAWLLSIWAAVDCGRSACIGSAR